MNKALAHTVDCLGKLTEEIFSCLLDPDYPRLLYSFERRLHKQKSKCLKSIQKIVLPSVRDKCAHLLEVLLDLSAIRWRVSDHSTFSIVAIELGNILSALEARFDQLHKLVLHKSVVFMDDDWLSRAIVAFEEMYFSIVNVAAKEPLVFLLFIDGLKTLAELLVDCQAIVDEGVA